MKRLLVLTILPMLLFGLETVNLIKDAGFEKDSEVWVARSHIIGDGDYDSTIYNRHDQDSAIVGEFCASIDGRTRPAEILPPIYGIEANFYQLLTFPKKLIDLDSLMFYHMYILPDAGKAHAHVYGTMLKFRDYPDQSLSTAGYTWEAPDLNYITADIYFKDTLYTEGAWNFFQRDINDDLVIQMGWNPESELDTVLFGIGELNQNGQWRSQKTFYDGIRLMGYADYDVGIKEILSGSSLEVGTLYAPIARIKNFGRENADSFLVIAEIADGASIIYSDTLPWTLEGDTEDTVTFADFDPPTTGPYTLTIRTFMEPDECDEDDEVSKEIGHSAIAESTQPSDLTLEVRSITSPLRVAYSLPYGKRGTLTLYDASGRRLERITVTHPGSVELDSAQASGVYLIRLEVGDYSISRKAVLLK